MRRVNSKRKMTLEEFIFSDRLSQQVNQLLSNPDVIPTVLCFHGFPGVGKTSFAQFLAEKLSYDVHHFAMNEQGLNAGFIKNQFAELQRKSLLPLFADDTDDEKTFNHGIILDEFHNLRPKEQDSFKLILEEIGSYLTIICVNTTKNRPLSKALTGAIKSRVHAIDFNLKDDEEVTQVVERVGQVFPELSAVKVRAWLPDMRLITREALFLRNIPQN